MSAFVSTCVSLGAAYYSARRLHFLPLPSRMSDVVSLRDRLPASPNRQTSNAAEGALPHRGVSVYEPDTDTHIGGAGVAWRALGPPVCHRVVGAEQFLG